MGRFRPLRMTIRGERMGSYLGDMLRVLELAVLYYDTSSPLEKGRGTCGESVSHRPRMKKISCLRSK